MCWQINGILFLAALTGVYAHNSIEHIKENQTCGIGDQIGRWVDISECPFAAGYVRLASNLLQAAEEGDALVCCVPSQIQTDSNCDPNGLRFEFYKDVHSVNDQRPLVVETIRCDSHHQRYGDGDACMFNGMEGVWTHDQSYCDTFDDNPNSGCCRLPPVSVRKCREYSALQMDENGNCTSVQNSSFLVELFSDNKIILSAQSGVLISEQYVLTTADCITDYHPGFVQIGTKKSQLIKIVEHIIHEDYSRDVWHQNDVGLLRLQRAVLFSANRHPLCLPHKNHIRRSPRSIIGFGMGERDRLKFAAELLNLTKCVTKWGGRSSATETQNLCVKRIENDPCYLKYGAAVTGSSKEIACATAVLGIRSGYSECDMHIFMRIFHFVPWIERKVWN